MSSRGGTVGRLEKDFSIVKLTSSMRRVEQKRQVSLLSMDLVRKWNRSAKRNRPIPDFMTTPRQSRLFSFDNPRKTHYIFQWPSKLKDSIALSSGAVSPKGRIKKASLRCSLKPKCHQPILVFRNMFRCRELGHGRCQATTKPLQRLRLCLIPSRRICCNSQQ